MADRFYALEKLTAAVDALATGAGRVQERLGHAAIHLVRVRPEDIPDENLRLGRLESRHHHGQRDAAVCTENSIRFDT